jgi:restriction endonuclease S subunit
MKKEVSLNDKELFELSIGKRILKEEVFNSIAEIPAYSANVFEPFGYVEKSNITDFSHDYLMWGIDGNFEFNIMRKGEKFATTDHCGVIKILNDKIVTEYLLYILRLKSGLLGFDRTLRSSLKNMRTVTIELPVDKNGDFDREAQQQIVQRNRAFSSIKEQVTLLKGEIENARVGFDVGDTHNKEVPIGEIFCLPSIKGLTKRFIESHSGDVPVYGGKQEEIPIGYVKDNLKNVKYFENCLAWNREGSVGYVFWHKSRFTTNDHHRPTTLKPEYEDQIDLSYMRYAIQDVLLKQGFRWSKTAGKEKVGKINVKIPITPKGEFDVLKQKEIARKYEKIDQIKRELSEKLETLLKCNISIE